jgi:2-oxo-3-hexenedioate decarboxylase
MRYFSTQFEERKFPEEIQQAAQLVEHARSHNYQITPLHESISDLDQKKGYHIAAALRTLRESTNGEIVAGRKIGFTNWNIWPEYNIDASNWSYMYRNTIVDLAAQSEVSGESQSAIEVDIKRFSNLEPRIEPEIVLGLGKPVSTAMDDFELLNCIEWIAHGYEIVVTIYPGWKFTAADTTAAFALHGTLLLGPKIPKEKLAMSGIERLSEDLSSFTIKLYQNNVVVDEGKGSNVLGSPIKALRHLIELLGKDEFNEPLQRGEIVTTGTLTRAMPIGHGDTWSTSIVGIGLPGLDVKFQLK